MPPSQRGLRAAVAGGKTLTWCKRCSSLISLSRFSNVCKRKGALKSMGGEVTWHCSRTGENSGSAHVKFPFKEHCVSCGSAQKPATATSRAEVRFLEDSVWGGWINLILDNLRH